MTVKFKAVYLTKLMTYLIILGIIFSVLINIFLPIDGSYRYFICMVGVFSGLLYIFYLNKNDVLFLENKASDVKFSFVNNSFFKRRDMLLPKSEIVCTREGDILNLVNNNALFAVIRKAAASEIEWNEILSFFNCK